MTHSGIGARVRNVLADLHTVGLMLLGAREGPGPAVRLDRFYRSQASSYDWFRARFLRGRQDLVTRLPLRDHGVWVDFGGGTGFLLEQAGARLAALAAVVVVDLSQALLDIGRNRLERHGWTNVHLVHGDVLDAVLPVDHADIITFSYSLTMMPQWFTAVDRAWSLLRPGGTIGVADFYVSPKYPLPGCRRHPWATRVGWPIWFARDDVFLSADHLPYLRQRFRESYLAEGRTHLPFVPIVRPPYYVFVGRRPRTGTPFRGRRPSF